MAETNEDPLAESREDPVVEIRKANMVEAGKAPVAKSRKTPAAETRNVVVVESGEDPIAGTREDHPVVEIREDHLVVMDFENLQKLWNGGVEAAAPAASSFSGSFQKFAAEATDYSKKSLESGSAFVEKLCRAKSLESAIQIQSDYAKSAYAEFVAYLAKMSDLYCNLCKRGLTPIEKVAAKIEGVKT